MIFAGIDYGSKMAGTTVVCVVENKQCILLEQSEKKKDADQFVQDIISQKQVKRIFIDAPLSLPGVYTRPTQFDNYFYRKADQITQAMSPMFLGGLTARAMRLKDYFNKNNIDVKEVYPSLWAKHFGLKELGYKKEKQSIRTIELKLKNALDFEWKCKIQNWHQIDALLAAHSGQRYLDKNFESIGDPLEGQIIF